MEEQVTKPTPQAMSVQIGTKLDFTVGTGAEGLIVLTLIPEVGEPLAAQLNAAEAQDISVRLAASACDVVNDMFLYAYFMMIIRQNQPEMSEESKHQLASKQVVNIRQFRKSMEDAAAAGIPHDTAIPV